MMHVIVASILLGFSVANGQLINITSTWIAGTSTTNSVSATGTIGVPSTAIYPGARQSSCFAITLNPAKYEVYIYGGQGYVTSTLAYQKDFWRYNIATTEWTQLPANSGSTAVTGSKGTESSLVFPGTLGRQACLISSLDNFLYMFGGTNGPFYNDLWRYNPTTGYWTWMGGGSSTTATVGVESSTIYPIARRSPGMVHLPATNTLLVEGGYANPGTGNGEVNDMWKFSLTSNAWTWIAGSQTVLAARSVFDSKGVATIQNMPGYRALHAMVIDPQTSVVYLFGGLISGTTEYLNDFWSYDDTQGMWVWISGGTASNLQAVKGTSLAFDATYTPGSRCSSTLVPLNGTDYLSMYGGRGYGVASASVSNNMNEMWVFSKSLKQWAWVVGSQDATTYGTRGVTSVGPYPAGRQLHTSGYLSSAGSRRSILVYGGFNTNYFSDMWKMDFDISGSPTPSTATTSATSNAIPSASLVLSSSTISASAESTVVSTSQSMQSVLEASSSAQTSTSITTASVQIGLGTTYVSSAQILITISESAQSGLPTVSGLQMSTSTLTTSVQRSSTDSFSGSALASSAGISTMSIAQTSTAALSGTLVSTDSALVSEQQSSTMSTTSDDLISTSSTDVSTSDTASDNSITSMSVEPSPTGVESAEANIGSEITSLATRLDVVGPAAAVLFLIVAISIYLCCRAAKSKPTKEKYKDYEQAPQTQEAAVLGNTMSETETSRTTASATAAMVEEMSVMNSISSFALPTHLKADSAYDFRCEQLISDDGQVKIFVGAALVPQLQLYGDACLIKVVAESRNQLTAEQSDAFDNEARVLNMVAQHRNAYIVAFLAWCEQPMAILTKLYTQGTLEQWIGAGAIGTKNLKLNMWTNVASGLQFLHGQQTAHGDIRPANVYIDVDSLGRPFAVLGNLSSASVFTSTGQRVSKFVHQTNIWCLYAAPEAIMNFHQGQLSQTAMVSFAGDIYSLAILSMEVLQSQVARV